MTREEAEAEFDKVRNDIQHTLRTYVRLKLDDGSVRTLREDEIWAVVQVMKNRGADLLCAADTTPER
jgi:hypothetical protein